MVYILKYSPASESYFIRLWRPRKLGHMLRNWSQSLKCTCPWKLSVKHNEYILEVPLRICSFLKRSSTNCSLLRFKSIEQSPNGHQWLVNVWTEGKHRTRQLAESGVGGALRWWTPWTFFSPVRGHDHPATLYTALSCKPPVRSCFL